jgi:hypothetical protein
MKYFNNYSSLGFSSIEKGKNNNQLTSTSFSYFAFDLNIQKALTFIELNMNYDLSK